MRKELERTVRPLDVFRYLIWVFLTLFLISAGTWGDGIWWIRLFVVGPHGLLLICWWALLAWLIWITEKSWNKRAKR